MRHLLARNPALRQALAVLALATVLAAPGSASPGSDGGDDRASKALERAARDADRASERAMRDEARFAQERAKILERADKDPQKASADLAKLENDATRESLKRAEDAAKDAVDLAEELAKAQDDAARSSSGHGSDDIDEAGSSEGLRDLADSEQPEHEERGFPVRRGQLLALDLGDAGLMAAQGRGFRVIEQQRLASLDSQVLRLAVPDGMALAVALADLRKAAPWATVDYAHYYGAQMMLAGEAGRSVPAPRAPRQAGPRSGMSIGMIDTGVARTHPALKSAGVKLADFSGRADAAALSHGTAIASILAREGTATIYAANVFRGPARAPFTSADAITAALEWLASNQVRVVNISLAGPRNALLDKVIARTIDHGTIVVAAAGNGGPAAPPAYPAALRSVVAVTAVDRDRHIYRYANQGAYITVAAPGVEEIAADAQGGYSAYSGTSFASPHVAAWIARCLGRQSGAACGKRLRAEARDLGAPGFDPVYGYGLLQ